MFANCKLTSSLKDFSVLEKMFHLAKKANKRLSGSLHSFIWENSITYCYINMFKFWSDMMFPFHSVLLCSGTHYGDFYTLYLRQGIKSCSNIIQMIESAHDVIWTTGIASIQFSFLLLLITRTLYSSFQFTFIHNEWVCLPKGMSSLTGHVCLISWDSSQEGNKVKL